jgi:acyl carrier protein
MEKTEILKSVAQVAQEVFGRSDVEFSESTTAAGVHEWDSLSNIELIVRLEGEFGIQFDLGELQDLPDLGALVTLIMTKTA